jgi:predicted transcriptional regulator of viral defense system
MPELIADKVLSRIYGSGRGKVFTPKDFLDLGSHASVRQVLARLEKQGIIRRLLRGATIIRASVACSKPKQAQIRTLSPGR